MHHDLIDAVPMIASSAKKGDNVAEARVPRFYFYCMAFCVQLSGYV
jgi:hypothetical protein